MTDYSTSVNARVDAKGLACPMPLLRAKQAINKANSGDVILVEATDRNSERDFRAFIQLSPHTLISVDVLDSVYTYTIKKGCN